LAEEQLTMGNFLVPVQDQMVMVEELMHAQAQRHHPDLGMAMEHLLSSGGKRIRPAVALLAGGMLGGETSRLITLAAAIELLHTATLVHDDLIDGALLRRGISTLNAHWSPAATVLTGDFIFAQAARLAAQTNSVGVMHLFAETLATIVNGELTQLFSSPGLASREDYDQRIHAKTASLFELATTAAALLSPVDDNAIETMRCCGYSIGMAFQIVDDILDFTGEQATVGKPVASDLRQGLITLPALYYLESHPNDERMKIVLQNSHSNEEVIQSLVASIRESGAIHYAMQDAKEFIEQGLEMLIGFPDNEQRNALEELARYIVNRQL